MSWRMVLTFAINVGEVIGVVLCGVSLLAVGAWLLSRIARKFGTDPTPMGTTKYTQGIRNQAEADAIRARAGERRDRAEEHRHEEHAIESGQPPENRYHMRVAGRR